MRGRGFSGALLFAVLAAAGIVFSAPARADTLELKAGPAVSRLPSEAAFDASWQLRGPAFVGAVVLPGAAATCPADYAQAMAELGAYSVLSGQRSVPPPPETGEGEGETLTLPVGVFTLCAWVQPEGDTATAAASAAAGPLHLSVGGPTGTTTVAVAATPQGETVQIPVSYTLGVASGEIAGLATANIGAWAFTASAGECDTGAAGSEVALHTPENQLSSAGAPVQGTVAFSGRLRPGTWRVCSYLLQTFAIPPTGLPNQVNAIDFGLASGLVTVLGPPRISALRARPHVLGRDRRPAVSFTLDQPAEVTVRLQRLLTGRRGGARRCLFDPGTGRRVCGRLAPGGTSRFQAPAGTDLRSLRIASRGRPPALGVYLLTAQARAVDGAGAPVSAVLAVTG